MRKESDVYIGNDRSILLKGRNNTINELASNRNKPMCRLYTLYVILLLSPMHRWYTILIQ